MASIKLDADTLRERFEKLRSNKLFETFVIGVILISALAIGAKTYDIPPAVGSILGVLDIAVTLFFLAEITVRMIAEGSIRRFFRSGWNIFDFIIVVASLVPLEDSETALLGRLLRVFRVLRLVAIIPELRVLLSAFVKAIPRMGYVSLLMFIMVKSSLCLVPVGVGNRRYYRSLLELKNLMMVTFSGMVIRSTIHLPI